MATDCYQVVLNNSPMNPARCSSAKCEEGIGESNRTPYTSGNINAGKRPEQITNMSAYSSIMFYRSQDA